MKGIILTLDAVIALLMTVTIISLLVFFRTETVSPFFEPQQLHSLSEDSLTILSESTLREVTNQTLLNNLKASHILNESDLNKNAIDVIGALWAANRSEAANISKDILDDIIPNNIGYQVLINGVNVYNSSYTSRPSYENATVEISSNRIASGYEFNKSVTGYVARAWASKIRKNVTTIIPIELAWGGFSSGYCPNGCWANGYAPASERGRSAVLIKNFTIPTDATIFSAYLQVAPDNSYTRVVINGKNPPVYDGSGGSIFEKDIKSYLVPGLNTFQMSFNSTISTTGDALAHFHPGTYMKIKYNTSEVSSGSNVTIFNASWIQGAPAAIETIPFFVNAQIRNITAYVDVQNINAFLLLTLNYKYNASNPMQNVILYRNYPTAIDCSQLSQSSCQAHSDQCNWNSIAIVNNTVFHSTFDSVSTGTNCQGVTGDGWNDCVTGESTLYWRAVQGGSLNSSSLRFFRGDDIDTANATYITKCLDLSSYSKAYLKFDWSTTNLDSGEFILIRVNKTGSSSFRDLWNSGSGSVGWTNTELNVTNNISSNTCFRVYCALATDTNEYCDLDDFKIIGTTIDNCENKVLDDVKNLTYEIKLNNTGTLINEYNSTGNILNTWFNTNVTLNNVQNNMTNTLGIFADIRAPINATVVGSLNVDWQRLGMYANDNTTGHGNDHYCYITDKTNVTVYHDSEQYGLEYGKVDINAIVNFTDPHFNCMTKNTDTCKDAFINLTFPFSTRIITSRVIGTQSLAGNDNGYNYVWIWHDGEANESHIVLDTDTPPGTITYLPIKFFGLNMNNTVRAADKDSTDRYLITDPTTYMGNKRSIVEYTFLIPSQVGYGDVFNTSTYAANDAINRLTSILGSYATSADIKTENYTVSNVPYVWGPANIKIRLWS